MEGRFEKGPEAIQFLAVIDDEGTDARRILRVQARHGGLHFPQIRRSENLATAAEHKPVMRIESYQIELAPEVVSRAAQNSVEDLRVMKKCRTVVEGETVVGKSGSSPAKMRQAFQYSHSNACLGQ